MSREAPVTEPVELSTLGDAQLQSWHAVMDLYEVINSDWTLIGGQLVHLHCAERHAAPVRPTDGIDTVLDVRANPKILETFTAALIKMGSPLKPPPRKASTGGAGTWPRSTS